MIIKYLTFAVSISFISWIIGIIVGAVLVKTPYYNRYFSNLNFITNARLNKYMGINVFRWIIIHSFFKYFNPKLSMPKTIKASDLAELRKEMTVAELNHLAAFVFVLVFVVAKLWKGEILFAAIIMLVNIIMNLYPSLLQQQNKRRIDRYGKFLTRSKPLANQTPSLV
ncbi:hypothetical protein GCM10027037_16240 [Mucilaginibacter koreensis]